LASVARSAGVSIATVSKVLNDRTDVAPHTRSRIQQLLDQHDYVAPAQRRPAVPQGPTIELQFAGEYKSYTAEALQGIMNAAADLGVSVAISKPDHSPRWARDLVLAGRCALIAVTSVHTAAHLNALERAGLPLVVLDPLHLPHSRVTSVGATNFAGGLAATQHLLSLGHQRIAYIGGPAIAVCNQARMHGYRAAMEAENIRVPRTYIRHGDFTYQTGQTEADALLDLAEPPTAIFAGNDEMAAGVLQAARQMGVAVPGDLSVVGFDDFEIARRLWPSLTTIRTPTREIGRLAVQRLMGRDDENRAEKDRLPMLVIRESSGAAS
jgi:LacI family transcriptional regulator